MDLNTSSILVAPLQGITDAAWRHFHQLSYSFSGDYHTPFIRWEKDGIRRRDIHDWLSPVNVNNLIPQVIFKNYDELHCLVNELVNAGAKKIDLNMGCPFPLQTARGRGAAAIARQECAEAAVKIIESFPCIQFSVKMRLGKESNQEWQQLLDHLNTVNLRHITVHPRIARQQYGGDVDLISFQEILDHSNNPIIYNGDLQTPQQIRTIAEQFPTIKGIMLGRGIICRPSLALETLSGEEWPKEKRLKHLLTFHNRLFSHYQQTLLGGEHQILSKIKPFWDYSEEEIGRKAWKSIRKASNLAKYNTAIAMI